MSTHTPTPAALSGKIISQAEIDSSISRLSSTAVGSEALRHTLDLLESGAAVLDPANQRAILNLLVATWTGCAGAVREQLREACGGVHA